MSVKGFTVDLADLNYRGEGLVRPECVLAELDGTLWTSDASQGGVTRIAPDGRQETDDAGSYGGLRGANAAATYQRCLFRTRA